MIEALTVGPIGERCYILPAEETGSCILVDPGDEARRILARLDELGLKPVVIALTHGHLDHTAALPDILEALGREGRQALVVIHGEDASYLGEGAEEKNRATFSAIRAMGFFKHYFRPMPKAGLIIADGDLLPGSRWKVIHTPGHTRGSACFYDEKAGILVSGDTLFLDGVGRTDGPDSDTAALESSIIKKLFCLPASTIVYPGHGESTTIGHERGDRAR